MLNSGTRQLKFMKIGMLLSLTACATALTFRPSPASAGPVIEIANQGSFFVGGHYEQTAAGTIMDGQMYVQFQIPARQRHPFPIVFIHGQGQSGVNFLSTPDGREGWADFFLRQGYAVYVVDQPLRGRSAYHADKDGPLKPSFIAEDVESTFTHPEAKPVWPQAKLHSQWPGRGVMGDLAFDQFYASELDSRPLDDLRMDELNRDDDIALLDKIGPAIVLTHSRAGAFGWLLADARPNLVKAIVAVEPWGPPFSAARPFGLTVAPIAFDPPVTDSADLAPREEDEATGRDPVRCLVVSGPPRILPHLIGIPILIMTGEASYHSLYDRCTSEFLTHAGVKNEWIRLGDLGIHGNGHMMMLELNNAGIAAVIDQWLSKHVTGHALR